LAEQKRDNAPLSIPVSPVEDGSRALLALCMLCGLVAGGGGRSALSGCFRRGVRVRGRNVRECTPFRLIAPDRPELPPEQCGFAEERPAA